MFGQTEQVLSINYGESSRAERFCHQIFAGKTVCRKEIENI